MFNNILIVTELEYLEDADKLVATALEMTKESTVNSLPCRRHYFSTQQ